MSACSSNLPHLKQTQQLLAELVSWDSVEPILTLLVWKHWWNNCLSWCSKPSPCFKIMPCKHQLLITLVGRRSYSEMATFELRHHSTSIFGHIIETCTNFNRSKYSYWSFCHILRQLLAVWDTWLGLRHVFFWLSLLFPCVFGRNMACKWVLSLNDDV